LIPAPDLEYALDRLETEEGALCLMSTQERWQGPGRGVGATAGTQTDGIAENDPSLADDTPHLQKPSISDLTDFTFYIDPAPVTLDICSPMDLVFECFVKLGLRYICVLREGKYAGLVHKKAFVRYCREVHDSEK